ncbi:MAG: hypothetical protein WAM77_18370 [Xanthobacteraceae bacterium]|jgi:hypothetical protein
MKPLYMLPVAIGLVSAGLIPCLPTAAVAQTSPPSYQADPDVYKVIFEDANLRVIKSVRKKGEHDKPHAHPLHSVIYFLTDCPTRQYFPDGRTVEGTSKAGTAQAVPIIQSHSAENIGPADCESLFVEKK